MSAQDSEPSSAEHDGLARRFGLTSDDSAIAETLVEARHGLLAAGWQVMPPFPDEETFRRRLVTYLKPRSGWSQEGHNPPPDPATTVCLHLVPRAVSKTFSHLVSAYVFHAPFDEPLVLTRELATALQLRAYHHDMLPYDLLEIPDVDGVDPLLLTESVAVRVEEWLHQQLGFYPAVVCALL